MTYSEAKAILDNCTHATGTSSDCQLSGGRRVCLNCWNAQVYARRQARKEQLATLPRCEVPTCTRRGAMHAMGVLLCQSHFDRANRAHLRRASQGIGLFLAVTYPREVFLRMAVEHGVNECRRQGRRNSRRA